MAVGLFHCKKMCKFTPKEVAAKEVAAELRFTVKYVYVNTKEVAAELNYFRTKQLVANISPVINVKAFLPVIVVVILQIETIE